jgi:predicted ArsR family transcriptional regulator
MTGPELAESFELTPEAIRQHLNDLSEHGLLRSSQRASSGAGRPPVEWSLTELALDLFPDRHADLTVSLIGSIRSALGDAGLDAVVAERTADQLRDYRTRLRGAEDKVAALASLRNDEGYMAEVTDAPDGNGRLLTEHHCPICDAAKVCQGLCRGELELFQAALGSRVTVTREQHLLAGDERCVYRIQ